MNIITRLLIIFSLSISAVIGVPLLAFAKEEFPLGKVIDKVLCHQDSTDTFAVYLPTEYNTKKKFPVILFFDPFARGAYAIEQYKELAEKFGYILIGSNKSENGFTWEQHNSAINTVMNNLPRFSYDPRRVFSAGYSGAAQVAHAAAIFHGGISGVIGCGGGFPPMEHPNTRKFDVISFAGHDDHNLFTLRQLHINLDKTGVRNHLLLFEGIHQWPSKDIIVDALYFFHFNSMRSGLIEKNKELIEELFSREKSSAKASIAAQDLIGAGYAFKKIFYFLEGLKDLSLIRKEFEDLQNMHEYKHQEIRLNLTYDRELPLMETLNAGIFNRSSMEWWKDKIDSFKQLDPYPEEMHLRKRVLTWLTVVLHMRIDPAIANNQLADAEYFLNIYKILEPGYFLTAYQRAVVMGLQGNKAGALETIKEARRLGFPDLIKIEHEPAFMFLHGTKEFEEILGR